MNQVTNQTGPKGKAPVIVWITMLSWPALPALVYTFFRYGRFSLSFTGAGKGGLALAWLLRASRILTCPARAIESTGEGCRVDDPNSRRLLFHSSVPKEVTTRFFATYGRLLRGLTYPDLRVRPDRVFNNLRKDLANTTHRLLDYLEFVRYQQEAEGARSRRLIIMSPDAVLAHMVPPELARPDVDFVCP